MDDPAGDRNRWRADARDEPVGQDVLWMSRVCRGFRRIGLIDRGSPVRILGRRTRMLGADPLDLSSETSSEVVTSYRRELEQLELDARGE
jgi:hypothetical protein